MKIFRVIIASVLLLSFGGAPIAMAQQERSTGSMIRKRTDKDSKKGNGAPGVTQRMQSFYEQTPISDADMVWMRVIYRSIDLSKEKNMALYYPEEPSEGSENLFCIMMRLLCNDQITAYEYLDGREVFTDQYKIKVSEMLDRFNIIYSEAKGSTEKHPKFVIDNSDIPTNEVLSYYILERWEFDRVTNEMKTRVEAICPVLHRSGDFGGESIKYPMFWMKFDALRPSLSQQYIFTDNDNNLARYNLDDYFNLGMYDGEIYKTRNLRNMSMMQMFPDPDDMKRAQDSIDNRLRTYTKNLWVPTREELAAKAEAEEKAEMAKDSVEIESRDEVEEAEVKSSRSNSKRGKKDSDKKDKKDKKKKKNKHKVKEQKVKTSSSSAVRSVRRRKR